MSGDRPTAASRTAPRLLAVLAVLALSAVVVGCTAAASPSPAAAGAEPSGSPSADSTESDRGERLQRRGGFVGPITITAIVGSSLSLRSADGWTRTVAVTADTAITRGGQPIKLTDLTVGDEIRLRQRKLEDGTFQVNAIAVIVPIVHGEVTAVGPSSLTIERRGTTRTVTVTPSTAYRLGDQDATKADVEVGNVVTIAGTRGADDSITAITVRIRLQKVSGTVASKTASTIVLTRRDGSTTTVRVDAMTTYHVRGVETATLADVDVGMRVTGLGVRRDDGSLDAVAVAARAPRQAGATPGAAAPSAGASSES
jgi:hypothetical protein